MAPPGPPCGALAVLLCCCAGLAGAQDGAAATAACYGAGSVAAAVVLTFLLTALLLVGGAAWWKRYRAKKVEDHLILETDPEKGKGAYAFDNPGFKDAPTKQPLESNKSNSPMSKWRQWTPMSAFTVKSERRKALDDSAIDGDEVKVISLKSHDFTGLGFNICGNMKEGIFVKDVLQRGPASESGRLTTGDRIHSVTINFEHMVYEDALTILGYASPYEVTIEAASGKLASNSPDPGSQPRHPVYRSSSWSDLYNIGKTSKRRLFSADINEPNSTYSSLQKSRSNMTTLERKESKSPKPKQPRTKKTLSSEKVKTQLEQEIVQAESAHSEPESIQQTDNKYQKFGVKVLPLEIQQKSPKILEQNQNNINIEKNQDEEMNKPPPVKRREKKTVDGFEKKSADSFERSSLNGSGIKRTKEGIPLELPIHMMNAASAALRNREDDTKKRKGRAPAAPPSKEYASDSDAEDTRTIELDATDVTVHQTEDEQLQGRKALSAGDLSQISRQTTPMGTLERAKSLDIPDEVLRRAPRLSLILDGLTAFERHRLKKSSEWGDLEDAILKADGDEPDEEVDAVVNKVKELRRESGTDEPQVKNQIWPSFDGQLNGPSVPRTTERQWEPVEEVNAKPLPSPVRKPVNNRIDEPFEAARGISNSAKNTSEPLEGNESRGNTTIDYLDTVNTVLVETGTAKSKTSPDRSEFEDETTSNKLDEHSHENSREEIAKFGNFAKSNTFVANDKTASNGESEKALTTESDDYSKTRTSIESSLVENEKASRNPNTVNMVPSFAKDLETVMIVPRRKSRENSDGSQETANSFISLEYPVIDKGPEPVSVVPHMKYLETTENSFKKILGAQEKPDSNGLDLINVVSNESSQKFQKLELSTIDTTSAVSKENTYIAGRSDQEDTAGSDKCSISSTSFEIPLVDDKTDSIDFDSKKSYTSFEIPITELKSPRNRSEPKPDRISRRQRTPEECEPGLPKPAEVLSKIPLLNSMVENQRRGTRVGNITDETKTVVTSSTGTPQSEPDLLDLTKHFLYTEQLNSYSYGGPHTNVPDDMKVSRHVSNVNVSQVSNGDTEMHSLELSINGDGELYSTALEAEFLPVEKSASPEESNSIVTVQFSGSSRRAEEAFSECSNRHSIVESQEGNTDRNGMTGLSNSSNYLVGERPKETIRSNVTVDFSNGSNRYSIVDSSKGNTERNGAVDICNGSNHSVAEMPKNTIERNVTVDFNDGSDCYSIVDSPKGNTDSHVTVDFGRGSNEGLVGRANETTLSNDSNRYSTVECTNGKMERNITVESGNRSNQAVAERAKDPRGNNVSVEFSYPSNHSTVESPKGNTEKNSNVGFRNGSNYGGTKSPSGNTNENVTHADALPGNRPPPSYITEIQVTPNTATGKHDLSKGSPPDQAEENELAKIKEIAERQLKKLPEMRFTTSSYEPARTTPERRQPSNIEHLRSNFEKPKLTRQESKSRIPIATSAKTPPMSPERRDSRNLDAVGDRALLELVSASVGKAPAARSVTVTSIRSGSRVPSGLPTLGGGRSPPRHGAESGFKQWVFSPSNVTNVVVTDDKRQ